MKRTIASAIAVTGLILAPSAGAASSSPSASTTLITLDETSGSHAPQTTTAHDSARTVVHLTTNADKLHSATFNNDARAYITSLVSQHRLPTSLMQGDDLASGTVVDVIDPSLHKVGFYHASGMTFSASDEDITNSALPQARQSHWPQAFAAMDQAAFTAKPSAQPSAAADTSHEVNFTPLQEVALVLGLIGLPVLGVGLYISRSIITRRRQDRQQKEAELAREQVRARERAEADAMPRPDKEALITHQDKIVAQAGTKISPQLRELLRRESTPQIVCQYLDQGADGWALDSMKELTRASANFLNSRPEVALVRYRDDGQVKRAYRQTMRDLDTLRDAPAGATQLRARIGAICDEAESRVTFLHHEYADTRRQSMTAADYVDQFARTKSNAHAQVEQEVRRFAQTPTGQALLEALRPHRTPSHSHLQQNSLIDEQSSANMMLNAVMYESLLAEESSSHHHSSSSSSSSSYDSSSSSSSSFDSSSFSSGGFDGGSSSW